MNYSPKRMNGEDPYKKMRREYEESGKREYNLSNIKKKNYKGKIRDIDLIFIILGVIFVLVTIVFYRSILKLNLLPTSYIVVFTIAEIIFTLLIFIGLARKHKTFKLNIFCLIIALLISGIYIYVINFANATSDF